eukprot:15477071-Alexandrium_andersonii.AAC.1
MFWHQPTQPRLKLWQRLTVCCVARATPVCAMLSVRFAADEQRVLPDFGSIDSVLSYELLNALSGP